MRILLLGATGMIGSRIAAEALSRGHRVTAVSRSGAAPPTDPAAPPDEAAVAADVTEPGVVARLAVGHDLVVSALAPPRDGTPPTRAFLAVNRTLIDGVRDAGVRRLLVVGDAGTLRSAPGTDLMDSAGFPEELKAEAGAHRDVLALLRSVVDVDWTYLCPPSVIGPGERTGSFRTGGDDVLADDAGHSRISAEDYAVALLDEAEQDTHPRARFTVAH